MEIDPSSPAIPGAPPCAPAPYEKETALGLAHEEPPPPGVP